MGPARLAGLVGYRRSTVWKVLRRHGQTQRRRSPKPASCASTSRRYEWSTPGALLHQDAKQLTRFQRPGHWAHGDRSEPHKTRGAGRCYAHCIVDDHTRLAYVETHAREDGPTAAAVLRRARTWLDEQDVGPTEAVMSDNAFAYTTSRHYQAALAAIDATHIRIPPRTPRWNGKVERFNRTLDEEWAHSQTWPSSEHRNRALGSWMRYYNRRRPHTSLGDRPPTSRCSPRP